MKYKVLRPLNHNQKDYVPGESVSLTQAQADHLMATGTVEPQPSAPTTITAESEGAPQPPPPSDPKQSPKKTQKTGTKERSGAATKAAPSPKSPAKTTKPKEA